MALYAARHLPDAHKSVWRVCQQTGTESMRMPLSYGPSPPPPSVSPLGGPASSGVQVVCEGGPFDLGTAALGPALTPSDMARGLDCFFAQVTSSHAQAENVERLWLTLMGVWHVSRRGLPR